MVTLSHMPFLLKKKKNFTIAIVFRVPLGISQSPKSSAENPANNHQVATRNFQ